MKHIHTQQQQDGEHRVRQKKINNLTNIFNKQERYERHGVNKIMFSGDGREGLTILNIDPRVPAKLWGTFSAKFVGLR